MKSLNDSKNIKMGVILSYVALGISIIGSLFITNRVLNLIGDYNYGLYSFVNSITSWLTVVSSALTASFLRFTILESHNNCDDVGKTNTIYFKLLLILGLIVFVIGIGLIIALYFSHICIGKYNWEDSKLMYFLFALSVFNIGLSMPTSIFSLYINYKKKFVFGKLLNIFIILFNFLGHFLIAYFTKNIVIIGAFTIVVTIMTFLINFIYCKKNLNISFAKATIKDNKSLTFAIIVFSSILLLNTIVDEVNTNVDKTLLGFFSIPENVTKYQMAQQLAGYFTTMSIAVSGVFAPSMHELVANNDKNEINNLYFKISKLQIVILCCVAFGFLTCGKNFILWWLGESRIDSYYVGVVLMIVGLGPLTMNASIEIQRAMNKHKFRALIYLVFAIVNVGFSVLFLIIFDSKYAIYACLLGTIISRVGSHWIAMNIYNKKVIKLPIGKYLLNLLIYIFIGVGCFFVVYIFNRVFIYSIESYLFRFLIQGFIFAFIYLLICFVINKRTVLNYVKQIFRRNV